jgi:hypothetical protein
LVACIFFYLLIQNLVKYYEKSSFLDIIGRGEAFYEHGFQVFCRRRIRFQAGGGTRMKLRVAGTANRLNVASGS